MRILLLSDDFLPNIGGIANHVHNLACAMSRVGNEVLVSTISPWSFDQISRFPHVISRTRNKYGYTVLRFPLIHFPRGRGHWWQLRNFYARYLHHVIDREAIDVLHWHGYAYDYYVVQYLNMPACVFTNHSSMFLEAADREENISPLRLRLTSADWVIAPSKELVSATIKIGYPADRVSYIPNGVDCNIFYPAPQATKNQLRAELHLPEDGTIILCARRFVEKNGLEYFVDMIPTIMKGAVLSKPCFIFAGNPANSQYPYARTVVRKLQDYIQHGLPVFLLGEVPYEKMPEIMRASDIALLPSLREATSLAALEAMSSGLAVVATKTGGLPELIDHGSTGYLVDQKNGEALSDAVIELANCPTLRGKIGNASREMVKSKYSWTQIAEETLIVYQRVLKANLQ